MQPDTFLNMPSSVVQLLAAADAKWRGSTPWGAKPALDSPGIYIVSTSADPGAVEGPSECTLSESRVAELIAVRPEITVSKVLADVDLLGSALHAMWPSGETVVYIGLAGTSVARRVSQFSATRPGARSPHAGGWPLRLLAGLYDLHVHVAAAVDPRKAEELALHRFLAGVNPRARAALSDPTLPLPYANLELTRGRRKRHGLAGATAVQASAQASRYGAELSDAPSALAASEASNPSFSLNVTAKDVHAGFIRVTQAPKQILVLPRVSTTLLVVLRGEVIAVNWDPRLGPDKERSGLLRLGKREIVRLLGGPCTLSITTDTAGALVLS